MLLPRRYWALLLFIACASFIAYPFFSTSSSFRFFPPNGGVSDIKPPGPSLEDGEHFQWAKLKTRYPVTSFIPMPSGTLKDIPRIQHKPEQWSAEVRERNNARRELVKGNFTHAWSGYKYHAWMSDEVAPLTGSAYNHFGGWAASLVDALDTLWIMELYDEFETAVAAVEKIDFSTCALETLNVFETTIRYLGGLLSAHDLSGGKYPVLLTKAIELGEMLYVAFDTPNRMPIARWNFHEAKAGKAQISSDWVLVSEVGSLTLEFTRLSQVTGDGKYFDAVQRVMDQFDLQQNLTKLPGLWPIVIDTRNLDFTKDASFTLGGMADSLYEYLPKQHLLLGGRTDQYQRLYQTALQAIKEHMLFRPMTPDDVDILFPGSLRVNKKGSNNPVDFDHQAQHLGCFTGGMLGIGAKIFNQVAELKTARQLTDGCVWAYKANVHGIMPEIFHATYCPTLQKCAWDEEAWEGVVKSRGEMVEGMPKGIVQIDDKRYILRPEAIESVFILHRITGDDSLLETAWEMWEAIIANTITPIAHAALDDCTVEHPTKSDRMESFWMAETLKYFYLIFSNSSVVSLDEYVFNTEAHPFKRPV